MNLFEFTVINMIFTFFPLLLYLVYVAYSRNVERKENNIFLELALFSSLYFVIRFLTFANLDHYPILVINVPLIIAYIKKRPIGIVTISILLIYYYESYFHVSWILLIVEYTIYLLLFLFKEKKGWKDHYFIILFLLIKAVFFGTCFFYTYHQKMVWNEFLIETISHVISLIVITYVSVLLFQKGEEILKLHMTMKELEKEKQIRLSLFQITHEIKNPIAVCKGYLDMFDVNNPDHSKRYIPILKDEIARTLILLQDFLSVQKIKIEKDILDMNLLLEEILASLEPLFKEKNIEVSSNIIDDEIYMNGDYNRLKQVFINLLKNSVEAMTNDKKHKLRIEINDLKEEVEIKVIDNGVGILDDNLKKMKQPFFSTKQYGTGLGIYLSNEIVNAHGGKINFESNDQGTTVILVFPKDLK